MSTSEYQQMLSACMERLHRQQGDGGGRIAITRVFSRKFLNQMTRGRERKQTRKCCALCLF